MVSRIAKPVPESERIRDVDAERQIAFGYQIRSRSIEFRDQVLYVKRDHEANHREPARKVDFRRLLLPPNLLNPCVTVLCDRPDLAKIVVAVVDTYVIRQQSTKSTADTAVTVASSVVKFLEYCWLLDIYSLKNVTEALWDTFFTKYASEGWPGVLEVNQRAQKIDWRTLRLSRRKHKEGAIEYSAAALLEAIGSNVTCNNIRLNYRRGEASGTVKHARQSVGLSQSSLASTIAHLNTLTDLPREMRASSVAHAYPYLYSVELSDRAPQRTENFKPTELAELMVEAYRWVNSYSTLIVPIIRKVYGQRGELLDEDLDEARMLDLLEARETRALEIELGNGIRITSVRRMGDGRKTLGLLGLIRMLLASCFLVLGVFNGRRKDEIQSRAIGLYADAFECLDDELKIYQCHFYCEKTTRGYRSFYVNEISFKALKVAKAISEVAWEIVESKGCDPRSGRSRKIFCWPPRSKELFPTWYEYSTDPGIAMLFARATGRSDLEVPNAHMFRRAYAVVFHYRYENANLYALAQQLDHRDLNMTMHYVLEGASRVIAHHASVLWGDGDQTRKERARHAAVLAGEVAAYGKEKLYDDIYEILLGQTKVLGGFTRLVSRFFRLMHGRIKYDDASLKAATKDLTGMLIARGHVVKPMSHGNCNAGPVKAGAGCYRGGRLAREYASPPVCGGCPYHSVKSAHVDAIRSDLQMQRDQINAISSDTIHVIAAQDALTATQRLVDFYATQMAMSDAR